MDNRHLLDEGALSYVLVANENGATRKRKRSGRVAEGEDYWSLQTQFFRDHEDTWGSDVMLSPDWKR